MFGEELSATTKIFGLELDDVKLDKFAKFYRMVIEQNRVMNLTTITEPREFAIKHVVDSLSAWGGNGRRFPRNSAENFSTAT